MAQVSPAAKELAPRLIQDGGDIVSSSLAFVRSHLDMEIAYLSEIIGDEMVFRAVLAPGLEYVASPGKSLPLTKTYCHHILSGRLPELIPDIEALPEAQELGISHKIRIRSHVSVPIYRTDGSVYGVFCCLSRERRPNLNPRDLEVMRAFASLSADQVNSRLSAQREAQIKKDAITHVLDESNFEIALQPILHLSDRGTAGFEALCRFRPEPYRPPNEWFDDAAEVGLQQQLELNVIEVALALLPKLHADAYLTINTSPATLASGHISKLVQAVDGSRIVVEITEHAAIDNFDMLLMEIDRLRDLGVRIAIDDAGAGYSGLQQIVRLRPNVIKLDMSLTKNIDRDLARRALASAMVQFAKDTNATVVAEGIETEAEMRTLTELGVEYGQGYHLGRPALAREFLARSGLQDVNRGNLN